MPPPPRRTQGGSAIYIGEVKTFCPNKSLITGSANSADPDEAAHDEVPHLNLHCLQIQLFFIFDILRLMRCQSKLLQSFQVQYSNCVSSE